MTDDPNAKTWGIALVYRRGQERLHDVTVTFDEATLSWRATAANDPGNEAVTKHWDATNAVVAVALAGCERDVSLRRVIPPAQYAAEKAALAADELALPEALATVHEAAALHANHDGLPQSTLVTRLAGTVVALGLALAEYAPRCGDAGCDEVAPLRTGESGRSCDACAARNASQTAMWVDVEHAAALRLLPTTISRQER